MLDLKAIDLAVQLKDRPDFHTIIGYPKKGYACIWRLRLMFPLVNCFCFLLLARSRAPRLLPFPSQPHAHRPFRAFALYMTVRSCVNSFVAFLDYISRDETNDDVLYEFEKANRTPEETRAIYAKLETAVQVCVRPFIVHGFLFMFRML